MKRLGKLNAVTYDAGDDFFVDIVDGVNHDGSGHYAAYLYREYMMRVPMYGMDKDDISRKGFLKRIEKDLDTYKEIYDDRLDYLEDWDCDYEDDDDDCVCCPVCGEPMIFGTGQEVEKAAEIQERFFAYVRENFKAKTRYVESVEGFIDWMKRSHPYADWWIACDKTDSLMDMFYVLSFFQAWRS